MTSGAESPAGFAALGLSVRLLGTLEALGYEEPTPIQQMTIPPLLQGRDLLGQAATGTGKTAAFALPLLERLSADGAVGESRSMIRALILVPTRELAMQVAEAIHRYGRELGVHVLPIYGGQAMAQQLRALRRGVDVVVATPGRALDHIRRNTLDLSGVRVVVLDEADEMLDMGFAEDLEAILSSIPAARQTALFSATIPKRIAALAERHLRDPVRIAIARERLAAGEMPRVRQHVYMVHRRDKVPALGRVLDMENPTSAIVFCRTRTEVDELQETLAAHGYGAEALHGGISQDQRSRVLKRFRDGASELLIATDVAARGLDIEHVSHVVNFDVPSAPDAYVHRIGRTGRAGREGTAITLAEPRERRLLRNIEQHTGQEIQVATVPTAKDLRARRMELTSTALRESLVAGDLDQFSVIVESLSDEFDLMDIATAAVKLAHETTVGKADESEIVPMAVTVERGEREERARPGHRGQAGAKRKRDPAGGRSGKKSKGRDGPRTSAKGKRRSDGGGSGVKGKRERPGRRERGRQRSAEGERHGGARPRRSR